jgi:hypothetical protein
MSPCQSQINVRNAWILTWKHGSNVSIFSCLTDDASNESPWSVGSSFPASDCITHFRFQEIGFGFPGVKVSSYLRTLYENIPEVPEVWIVRNLLSATSSKVFSNA